MSGTTELDSTDSRIGRLREQMAIYRVRYPIDEELAGVERLEASVAKRTSLQARLRNEVEHLESRVAELEGKRKILDQEIAGFERALEALMDDTLDRMRIEFGEAWSPTPILGFRMWTVEPDGLHGAKERWTSRHLEARCLARGPRLDVPHSEGVCGSPPCGIYAVKELSKLISQLDIEGYAGVALGLVALSGKVVEHEHGYRAAKAEVVAVAVTTNPLVTADTPAEIDQLFQRNHWNTDDGAASGANLVEAVRHVEHHARRYHP